MNHDECLTCGGPLIVLQPTSEGWLCQCTGTCGGLQTLTDEEMRFAALNARAHLSCSTITDEIQHAEKMVAVTLRREFPDLLPSTDAWRPIAQRACELIVDRVKGTDQ